MFPIDRIVVVSNSFYSFPNASAEPRKLTSAYTHADSTFKLVIWNNYQVLSALNSDRLRLQG